MSTHPRSPGDTLELRGGVHIPRLGLGVFRTGPGTATQRAVVHALSLGYRHIDTARIYGNEREVGEGLRQSGVPREQVFVTTKLWNDDQGFDQTLRAFDRSLAELGLEQLDLYLMHWPVPGKRLDSWRAMERLLEEGRCRAIGVSNFTVRHLDELAAHARVVPAVNQVEMSPFLAQAELRRVCAQRGIVVEAYSPLTKGKRLGDPRLGEIAARLGRTPAQVLIRYCLQKDVVVLPKSARPERIAENAAVFDFDIPDGEMVRLDALDEGLHTAWDPTDAP